MFFRVRLSLQQKIGAISLHHPVGLIDSTIIY